LTAKQRAAIIVYSGDHLEGIFTVEIIDGKITNFYAMRNPDKLATISVPGPSADSFCHARTMRVERVAGWGKAPSVLRALASRRRSEACLRPPP